jgi:hypothetical protein
MKAFRVASSSLLALSLLFGTGLAVAQPASPPKGGSVVKKPPGGKDVPKVKEWVKVCNKHGICRWKLIYKGNGIP